MRGQVAMIWRLGLALSLHTSQNAVDSPIVNLPARSRTWRLQREPRHAGEKKALGLAQKYAQQDRNDQSAAMCPGRPKEKNLYMGVPMAQSWFQVCTISLGD